VKNSSTIKDKLFFNLCLNIKLFFANVSKILELFGEKLY